MGDRAQVLVKDEGVYLYTHWGGHALQAVVRRALARRERWDDPEYLARILFCEMIGDDVDGETGYGIGTNEHCDNEHPVVVVNCADQTVTIDGAACTFEDYITEQTGD